MNNTAYILLGITFAFLSGCIKKVPALPEVSGENCRIEKIMEISDLDARKEFAGLCSRRSIGPNTLPANPRKW